MQVIENIVLGLIQGLTEFIPVSSSGHLVIAQNYFAGASDHLFLEFINIGTVLALIIFFRKKIVDIFKDIFINKDYKLGLNILITAIPAGLIGFMMASFIESNGFFGSLTTVALAMSIMGLVMIFLEKLVRKVDLKGVENLKKSQALIIGLAQVFALIPGVSRSGSTIVAGRLVGLKPRDSAQYSFLASLPIMLGVTFKTLLTDQDYLVANFGTLVVSNSAAFLAGILAIGFLMKYLSTHSLAVFGWYRLGVASVLGVIILLQ